MSKLEELLKKHCPNGAEYKALSDLGSFYAGLNGKNKDDFKDGNAKYITYMNVFSNLSVNININDTVQIGEKEKQNIVKYGDVIFTGSSETIEECGMSSVVTNELNEKLYLNSFCFGFRFNEPEIMLPDFSKYLFRSTELRKKIIKTASGVTRFNVSKKKMEKILIPLPPIEVQKEIVGILDTFTKYQDLLNRELELRKKQYEYYRGKLLTFGDEVELKNFGEVCDVVTDYVAAGSFKDIAKNVEYIRNPDYAQLVRTTDIKNNFKNDGFVYINKKAFDYLYRVNLDKESIILPNIGINCGEVYYITPNMLPYKNNALGPNAILVRSSNTNNKFLSYIFEEKLFQTQLRRIISTAGQPKFNKTELKKIKIPVPPLEEQERIVNILDKFDALCNDITKGLPAEIEMRKKQYEYYRDKLLTFKEKK